MMKDYRTHLETLRQQAAESTLISSLATPPQKRAMFAPIAVHLNTLAAKVERAMAAADGKVSGPQAAAPAPTEDLGSAIIARIAVKCRKVLPVRPKPACVAPPDPAVSIDLRQCSTSTRARHCQTAGGRLAPVN